MSTSPTPSTFQALDLGLAIPLSPHTIHKFRGAVAASAGYEQVLFHNHKMDANGETLANQTETRYPLIQYRLHQGQAALWAAKEGVDAVRDWIWSSPNQLRIGRREYPVRVEYLELHTHSLKMTTQSQWYRILDYVPFNQENYQRYRQAINLHERIDILESTLKSHILGFSEAMGYHLSENLDLHLMSISSTRRVQIHDHPRMAFNLIYRCNMDLPPGIALGRSVAHGFGVQRPVSGK